jgi:hypothetical protein
MSDWDSGAGHSTGCAILGRETNAITGPKRHDFILFFRSTRLYRGLPCVESGQVRIQGASQELARSASNSALCVAR